MAQTDRRCLIVPAAGLGTRFTAKGYKEPKPFVKVHDVTMVELVVRNLRSIVGDCRAIVVLREEMRSFASQLQRVNNCDVVFVPSLTQGAANTVLFALQHVKDECEIIVANSDQVIDVPASSFDSSATNDGVIVTFRCPERNAKWSYAAIDSDGYVERVAEKNPISEHATVGVYFYKSASLLKDAIHKMVASNDRTNNEFYLCPAYNHMPVGTKIVMLETRMMFGLGLPEDLEAALATPEFNSYVEHLLKSEKG